MSNCLYPKVEYQKNSNIKVTALYQNKELKTFFFSELQKLHRYLIILKTENNNLVCLFFN